MNRLAPSIALLLALGACAQHRVSLEGLRPRAAEAIDPRVPLPTEAVAGPQDMSVAGILAAEERRADDGVAAFNALLPRARAAAAAAGGQGSESWIGAQELLSTLVGARAPLTTALANVDALAGGRLQSAGDIGVADRKPVFDTAARLAAIDAEQQATIAALRAQLGR